MILLIIAIISVCNGFLLPNNNTGGTGLTGQHYIYVMDLLGQQRQNQQQMEKFILKLSSEVKSLQQVAGLNQANWHSQEVTHLQTGYSELQKKFITLNQELVQVKQELLQVQNDNNSLNQELIQVKQELMQLKNDNSNLNQELIQVKNDNNNLNRELTRVKSDHSALNRKTEMLQSEIYLCGNDTMKLRTGLETFTHFISGWVLNNITQIQSNFESLENKMDKTNIQLNVLTSNSNSGSQNVLALLNQTKDTQHKMTILDTETKQHLLNYQTSTNSKIMTMENYLQGYQNSINQKSITIATDLHSYQNSTIQKIVTMGTDQNSTREKIVTVANDLHSYQTSTNQKIATMASSLNSNQNSINKKIATMETHLQSYQNNANNRINDVFHKIAAINQTVVLTSYSGSGSVSGESVVKFPNTDTVYGISDVSAFISSGKFTCEVGGVYLFSVFITSHSSPSSYGMYRNNHYIPYVYIVGGRNNGNNRHTGTGIMAVSLNVGDTLYVKAHFDMYVYGSFSCMTVIKIT